MDEYRRPSPKLRPPFIDTQAHSVEIDDSGEDDDLPVTEEVPTDAARLDSARKTIGFCKSQLETNFTQGIRLPSMESFRVVDYERLAEGLSAILKDYRADKQMRHLKNPAFKQRVAAFLESFVH